MDNHESIKRMAIVWKLLRQAIDINTCSRVFDCLDEASNHVYEVGEKKFGKEFIDEVKAKYYDS